MTSAPSYFLGTPMWTNKSWVGLVYTTQAKSSHFLKQYSSVFTTVEGHSTFHATPRPETLDKWREETPASFQFCFKFPQTITHDKRLQYAEQETEQWLKAMERLGPRLGTLYLQLPPSFGIQELPALERYLAQLPQHLRYAVEVRNSSFFPPERGADPLHHLLEHYSVDRVILDTRGVYKEQEASAGVTMHRERKPPLPVLPVATGQRPFIRYIGHSELNKNVPYWKQWIPFLARWIQEGRQPYWFMHAPRGRDIPVFARTFHRMLQQWVTLPDMPPWPAETEPSPQEQLSMF